MKPRVKPDLAMNWSRTTSCCSVRLHGAAPEEGRALLMALDPFFRDQLEQLGYDLRTLRFSIRKLPTHQQAQEEAIA